MKKILLLSAVVLTLSLNACNKDDDFEPQQEQQIEKGSPNQNNVAIEKGEYYIPTNG